MFNTLNPQMASSGVTVDILSAQLYDRLLAVDSYTYLLIPELAQVVIDLSSGGIRRLSRLLTSECDVLGYPAASQLSILRNDPRLWLTLRPGMNNVYLEKRIPGPLAQIWCTFYHDAMSMLGLYGFALLILLFLFGTLFAPYPLDQQFLGYQLLPPSCSRYGDVSFSLVPMTWAAMC